jgi:diguanylate cyclase (GGDEF)-like protein
MPGAGFEVAHAGNRVKRRVLLALALSSVLPLLVLAHLLYRYVLPAIDPADSVAFFGVETLVLGTVVAMGVGAWIVWSVGRTIAGMAHLMAQGENDAAHDPRRDEIHTLMSNFSRMFETIEHQANEINSFATRLDAAYKELESTNARLKETSFKDEVTGIYNRRFFSIRLEEEISRHRRFTHPVSIVLLDLDGFKGVNDEFGHAVGDDTLRDVAQILMKHSRGINVVSRYGGDEFAVLLVETSKAGARLYADRIREVVAQFPFAHGKPVTASLGVASLPDDDVTTAEDLFKLADGALYTAKRSGKNQVVASETVEKKVQWTSGTS